MEKGKRDPGNTNNRAALINAQETRAHDRREVQKKDSSFQLQINIYTLVSKCQVIKRTNTMSKEGRWTTFLENSERQTLEVKGRIQET